jgi:UDP-GlcNAc3NAcA epimerase
MLWLLQNCKMVITDSGGLQKEAYFFGKPCITLRNKTEWVELIEEGVNVLAGANKEKIIEEFNIINNGKEFDFSKSLYGSGDTGDRIVTQLLATDEH